LGLPTGLDELRYTGAPVDTLECPVRFTVFKHPLLLVSLSVFLSACGTNPYSLPRIESPEPEYSEPEPEQRESAPETVPEPQPEVSRPASPGAHVGLLAKADIARENGNYSQALAYLERAQRIDPDNAEIYLGLAQTHYAAGNASQARATAERGLLYCNGSMQCDALRAYAR
jgi:tetratricopeptide (TPR) repeat protein